MVVFGDKGRLVVIRCEQKSSDGPVMVTFLLVVPACPLKP